MVFGQDVSMGEDADEPAPSSTSPVDSIDEIHGGRSGSSRSKNGKVKRLVQRLVGPKDDLAVRAGIVRGVFFDAFMLVPVIAVNVGMDDFITWLKPQGITLWGTNLFLAVCFLGSLTTYVLYLYTQWVGTIQVYREKER